MMLRGSLVCGCGDVVLVLIVVVLVLLQYVQARCACFYQDPQGVVYGHPLTAKGL